MALISTVKWIASKGPISRTEKLVSTGVVLGLNYLSKQAFNRGDFHEANHNLVALLMGNSVHEHDANCVIPADRMINAQEGAVLTEKIKAKKIEPGELPGFYM